jgi:hypothetical protein
MQAELTFDAEWKNKKANDARSSNTRPPPPPPVPVRINDSDSNSSLNSDF